MAKVSLHVPGAAEPVVLDWRVDAQGRFSVAVDAPASSRLPDAGPAEYQGNLTVTAPGEGWIGMDGRILPFYMTKDRDTLTLWLDGRTYTLDMIAPGGRREAGARHGGDMRPGAGETQGEIKAPMPGSIVKVAVRAGERVTVHQPLVILESMKMEMTLSAHAEATVRAVRCAEGQLVALGDVLVELES